MSTVRLNLDEAARNRIVNALKLASRELVKAARSRPYAGPNWKDTRAIMREDARHCLALADTIRHLPAAVSCCANCTALAAAPLDIIAVALFGKTFNTLDDTQVGAIISLRYQVP